VGSSRRSFSLHSVLVFLPGFLLFLLFVPLFLRCFLSCPHPHCRRLGSPFVFSFLLLLGLDCPFLYCNSLNSSSLVPSWKSYILSSQFHLWLPTNNNPCSCLDFLHFLHLETPGRYKVWFVWSPLKWKVLKCGIILSGIFLVSGFTAPAPQIWAIFHLLLVPPPPPPPTITSPQQQQSSGVNPSWLDGRSSSGLIQSQDGTWLASLSTGTTRLVQSLQGCDLMWLDSFLLDRANHRDRLFWNWPQDVSSVICQTRKVHCDWQVFRNSELGQSQDLKRPQDLCDRSELGGVIGALFIISQRKAKLTSVNMYKKIFFWLREYFSNKMVFHAFSLENMPNSPQNSIHISLSNSIPEDKLWFWKNPIFIFFNIGRFSGFSIIMHFFAEKLARYTYSSWPNLGLLECH
jgi:hypothetical protein